MSDALDNLTSNQAGTVAFITGLSANGALSSANGWTWAGTNPATYATDSSAHKWAGGLAGTPGGTVSYYFDPGSDFSSGVEQMYVSALTLWSDQANINFVETTDPSKAQISFYLFGSTTPSVPLDNGAYATAVYTVGTPGATSIPATQAVAISIEQTGGWAHLDSFTYDGGEGPATIVHELGHALGLMHSGPYNAQVNQATQQYNTTDMYLWSAMSYIKPTDTNAKYFDQYPVQGTNYNTQDTPTTSQILDILGMQQLYGLPTSTTFSGGQVFGFNSNISDAASPFFDFTVNTDPVVTLWDQGTGNTLDLSGFFTPSYVNLNPGTFSNVDGMVNNIAIAFNTAIDTAIGGAGNDTFVVNSDSDTINGGGGSNTVLFPFAYAAYVITPLGGGGYSVSDGATTTHITNTQTLAFADQTIAVAALPTGDTFQWNVGNGAYSNSASWTDVTKGLPATSPPGANDIALIPGPTTGGPQTISGSGDAAQMVFTGLSGVTGSLTPGLLTVGQGGGASAMLTIAPGAAIEATSAAVANGTLRVIGTFTATNALTLAPVDGDSSATVQMRSGGTASVGSLVLNGGTVGIDATSTFEVGTAGTAATGTLTVDPGSAISGNGLLGTVVDNGNIFVVGGNLNIGDLTGGTGQVTITAGATLTLGGDTTVPIIFNNGTGGVAPGLLAVTGGGGSPLSLGQISGFTAGNAINITTKSALQQPTYDAATGVVTAPIAGGTISVEGTLVGNYSENVFLLLPQAPSVYSLITAPGTLEGTTTPSDGTEGSSFAWISGSLAAAPGDWNNAAMWQDLSDSPQAVAPGQNDTVFVQGANQPNLIQVISGNGNAKNLTFAGADALSGTITVGNSLSVGMVGNPATLALIGTAAVTANAATVAADGMFDIASGTSLTVTNGLTLTSDASQNVAPLESYGGGIVQVGSLVLTGTVAPIALDSASSLEIGTLGSAAAGMLTVDADHSLTGTGDLSRITVVDNASIVATGGVLSLGTIAGTGSLIIDGNATLALSLSEPTAISFAGPNATLLVSNTNVTLGTVMGFTQGETIAVSALPQSLPTKVTYTQTGANIGTLALTNAFGTDVQITLAGNYTGANFVIGAGGSPAIADVTIACFAAGTCIATESGPVAVEHLRVGDQVAAHFAQAALPVVWIGHRRIDCRRHPSPLAVWPIRIQAGCFGQGLPVRDLYLSPDHAVLVDGVLIPVKYLINDTTIARIECDEVTYYHVELAQHDVVFAEGLAAESYLDTGDRAKFANGGVLVAAHPDFASRLWEAEGCAPLVIAGPALAVARSRLAKPGALAASGRATPRKRRPVGRARG